MKQDSWEMFLAVLVAGGALIWALLHDEKPKPPKIDPPTRIPKEKP